MAVDDGTTAAGAPPTATLSMEDGTQTVRLPAGWELPGTAVRLRRVGETIVLEPIVAPANDDAPIHPSWPPGYIEWLRGARARGEFDHDEVEPLHFQFLDLNLDDMP